MGKCSSMSIYYFQENIPLSIILYMCILKHTNAPQSSTWTLIKKDNLRLSVTQLFLPKISSRKTELINEWSFGERRSPPIPLVLAFHDGPIFQIFQF